MDIIRPLLLELPFPIKTPRLTIVPAHPDYAQDLHDAILESEDVLRPWMPWVEESMTLDDRRELLVKKYAKFVLREEMMLLAFTHEGEFVVATGFNDIDWHFPTCMIGYWCKKSAQGKGYVTEVANALTRYAFEAMKMRKVRIDMDSENKASEAVALRLNMVKEAEMRFGIKTLHVDRDRLKLSYACFDTAALPPLDVNWVRN